MGSLLFYNDHQCFLCDHHSQHCIDLAPIVCSSWRRQTIIAGSFANYRVMWVIQIIRINIIVITVTFTTRIIMMMIMIMMVIFMVMMMIIIFMVMMMTSPELQQPPLYFCPAQSQATGLSRFHCRNKTNL